MKKTKEINLKFNNNSLLQKLLGINNKTLKVIESMIDVQLESNGDVINVSGEENSCKIAKLIIEEAYNSLAIQESKDTEINDITLNAIIRGAIESDDFLSQKKRKKEIEPIKTWKKFICPKTNGQKNYLSSLKENDVIFCTGPAGTGKTYLAVAHGIQLLKNNQVERIILSRPAVEAGEKLGFLPGDVKEKVDPYLRPIYDAINDMVPYDRVEKKISSGEIEIAPLAFMRGRTLSNSFIIIDEAQNTTQVQMKMLLTRLGESSKMVITGDLSQIDLMPGQSSGLVEAIKILDNIEGINITKLSTVDIVRHPVVARIVKAYERIKRKQ